MSSASSVDRPVVLVGSGRCGSTLLQSVLNTNPDFLIWGEHNGFLREIAAARYGAGHQRFPDKSDLDVAHRIKRLRSPRHWPAWDNLCGDTEFLDRFRIFIRSLFADPTGQATRWGFKEIRYARCSEDQTLKLMFECFPETRLIILIRDPKATIFSVLSHWVFAHQRGGNIETQEVDSQILAAAHSWNVQYMRLHALAKARSPNSLRLRYEDLKNPETYEKLSQFLGASPFDYEAKIVNVKDASNKTDPTAQLIRGRLESLQASVDAATSSARAAYGYPNAAPLRQAPMAM